MNNDPRDLFRNEMAKACISSFDMNPESLTVISKWADWDDLFDAGFRAEDSGEAFQEWINFH